MALFTEGKLFKKAGEGSGGGGGGDQHNLGWYATQSALEEAHPTAEAGDWAIVGETDTIWIWDTDNSEWVNSDQKPGSEIEWVAKVDLPASSGLGWEACPKYTVAGGIPDGRYSFYFRTKALSNDFVVDLMYKVNFLKNGNNIQGTVMPVINGDFFPENNYKLSESSFTTVFWYNTINNDFVIYKQDIPFATNAAVYYPDMAVPECFAISNIVNVDTGVEYVPTGILNDRSYDDLSAYNSYLSQTKIDAAEPQKTSYSYGGSTFDDLNQYICFNGHYISSNAQVSSITNFWVSLKIDQGSESGEAYIEIKNEYSKPIVRIFKATDSLENIQVGFDQNNYLTIKLNTPTSSTGHISWLVGSAGYNETLYVNVGDVQTFTPVGVLTVGYPINGDNFGAIEQYKGDTDANYTNGYFYKATGTETIIPESVSPTIDPGFPFADWTATIVASNLIEDMNSEVSWGVAYFTERLENQNAIIYINYTIEFGQDPVIQSIMFEGATFTTPAVLNHFALTRVNKDSSGNGQIGVYPHYTPEHAEYTNTSWEQINVQPGGLPDQTGNTGKFLTTDGTDASWATINALQNTATRTGSIGILGTSGGVKSISVGSGATANGNWGIAIGESSSIGNHTRAIAIGASAVVNVNNAIQISVASVGQYNSDANTFKVANTNGNFEIMSANGTIPTARLTKVNSTITLTAAGWSSNTQTVNVTGITADGVVFVSPDPTDQADYTSAGIICSAQAAGTLTFTCSTTPINDINVVVVML